MQTMQIRHQIKIVCSWSQSQAKYPLKIAGYPRVSVSQSTKHKKKKKNRLVNRLLRRTNNNCCLWQCCWCCFHSLRNVKDESVNAD